MVKYFITKQLIKDVVKQGIKKDIDKKSIIHAISIILDKRQLTVLLTAKSDKENGLLPGDGLSQRYLNIIDKLRDRKDGSSMTLKQATEIDSEIMKKIQDGAPWYQNE